MEYCGATICLNGHVQSDSLAQSEKYCSRCGVETFSECPKCSAPIRGQSKPKGTILANSKYMKPYYCYQCSFPYPWTSKIINNAVELASLDEIGEENIQLIRDAIPDLIVETPKTPVAVTKYKKGISNARGFIKDALRQLLVDVVCELAKQQLFM